MAIQLKIGSVASQVDMSQGGMISANFGKKRDGKPLSEPVRYVTPYGNSEAAFVAIPEVGSQILVAYEDDPVKAQGPMEGYYYLGSIMGTIPGKNMDNVAVDATNQTPKKNYVKKTKEGVHGPALKPGDMPSLLDKDVKAFPDRFEDLYEGKGVIPEKIGLTNWRGDALMIANRYKGNEGPGPFQSHYVGMHSGNGKRVECVDSPIIDGIVMTNEHKGKDYLIWSSGDSDQSPFTEGEYHLRTHGPIRQYSLADRFHIWIQEGLNIEIENKSSAFSAYGPQRDTNPDGRFQGPPLKPVPKNGLIPPEGGARTSKRIEQFGNETTGCIKLLSHHNNISLSALAMDSVININAPGPNTKVIVNTGGYVDIVAKKKITIQSDEKIEINADVIDINGKSKVDIDSTGNINLNGNKRMPPN